ncbi:MAG: hypothetical protein KC766_23730, partial [Myxococcales bacterium]|nr:hypothetical protein [Myxococcales bacterium]
AEPAGAGSMSHSVPFWRGPGRSALLCALSLCGALGLYGCGAGQAAPKDAPSPPPPGYQQQQYPSSGQPGSQEYAQPPGSRGLQPPAAPPATASPFELPEPNDASSLTDWQAYFDRTASALTTDLQCFDACRALQSLERAQKRICEILAGGDDPGARCERAKERVAAAKSRVESQCDCPASP